MRVLDRHVTKDKPYLGISRWKCQ